MNDMVYSQVVIGVVISSIMCSGISAQERTIPIGPNTVRVQLHEISSGTVVVVESREKAVLEPPIRGQSTVHSGRIEVVPLVAKEGTPQEPLVAAGIYGLEQWAVAGIRGENAILVASEMEGTGPFERPNNPLMRIWLMPVLLAPSPKNNAAAVRSEEIADRVKELRKTSNVSRLVFGGSLFPSVQEIVGVIGPTDTGVCVGRTEDRGLWAKGFSLIPIRWHTDGGSVKGSFTSITVAIRQKKVLIAAIENGGTVKIFSPEAIADLDQAKPAEVVLPSEGAEKTIPKEVALVSYANESVLCVVANSGSQDRLYVYNNLIQNKDWKGKTSRVLTGKATSLSILVSRTNLVYAYISQTDKGRQIRYGSLALADIASGK